MFTFSLVQEFYISKGFIRWRSIFWIIQANKLSTFVYFYIICANYLVWKCPHNHRNYSAVMFEGTPWCCESPVSRTAVRYSSVSSLAVHEHLILCLKMMWWRSMFNGKWNVLNVFIWCSIWREIWIQFIIEMQLVSIRCLN